MDASSISPKDRHLFLDSGSNDADQPLSDEMLAAVRTFLIDCECGCHGENHLTRRTERWVKLNK